MTRVEESRRRVQRRLADIAEVAERDVSRAVAIKDAAIALLGVVGMLVTARRVGRSISRRKEKRREASTSRARS